MGITFKRGKLDDKSTVKDYCQGKRTPPILRWVIVVFLISIPLIYLIYMLLDETIFAEFQGVVMFDTVKIRAPAAGYVETLYVNEGEHVKRGKPLLQFKSPGLDTQLVYLRKEKDRIDKQIDNINRKSTESLKAHLAVLEKDILSSQLVYQKFAKYYKSNGHMASLELEQARKNVISAKQAYSQLEHQIKQVVLENDLMIEVNYKRKQEEINNKIRQAEQKKKYFLIKSPAKGAVKRIKIHHGEFLPAGQDIIDIVTKNNLHVVAYIDPKEAEIIRPGITVTMTFPDHFKTKGEVIDVPNYADKTPMTFQNPLATRENKLIAIVKFKENVPEKYRVFGFPVEVNID